MQPQIYISFFKFHALYNLLRYLGCQLHVYLLYNKFSLNTTHKLLFVFKNYKLIELNEFSS